MRHDCFHKTFPSAERVGCNPSEDELYLIETLDTDRLLYAILDTAGDALLLEVANDLELPMFFD
jgi:hypothetical protein